ncbi:MULTISPECIES: DUF554 domain-containing protein [Trichocoleus]|uniref:DUF554 domain-containing protein n=1 Tax=Trichocoleus desertorum GB2-A4 TaxID=2933944 RepID=A0ABV0JAX3_9CYAN|nr:DUF554 domain-containing protein [Trichocoleus sp. FACHB-46]MBD1863174.1 DUF554 domain-containing protein [Trichocoleus sp. FACHB-46]
MTLDFWAKTSGTWINIGTVLAGTALGLGLQGRLSMRMQRIITQGLGLITLFVGIQMAGSLTKTQAGRIDGVVLALLAIALGGLLGEWWQLEERLTAVGDWLKQRFKRGGGFTDGFVAASLLFCVGPMTLIGSLNNGLTGDNTLLTLKATMDGLAAIAFTSSFGIGVGFSTLIILVYQGGLSLAAGLLAQSLPDPATDPCVLLVTGVGGLMILGISLNLLEIAQVRVASFLPALALAPLIYFILAR